MNRAGRVWLKATLRAVAGTACVLAAMAAVAQGTYHNLERNRQPCSECHTLHYSEDGGSPLGVEPGGPFDMLMLRETTNKLCLFCHDGSDPTAPDVLLPVTMYVATSDEHSGAGFFEASGGFVNRRGHDLGAPQPVAINVPFSTLPNFPINCASCHDPHGTTNYRNILTNPRGGLGIAVQMERDVYRLVSPGEPPTPGASQDAYREANLGYKAATSRWCAECHDLLKASQNNPGNRRHHLTDVPIDDPSYPTDPAHWVAGIGNGFGATTGDGIEGVPRLRFQVPLASDYSTARVVAPTNEVMCSTCHLAHGGRHRNGLVWPYRDPGNPVDKDSGCNQCHNY